MDKSLYVVFMYIVSHAGLILFLYPENIIASTTQGHWVPIVIEVFVHFFILTVFLKGLNYFPKQNDLITIYTSAGKIIAFLFLVPIFLYFLTSNIITVRGYSEIITIVFLSNTPLWAIMVVLLAISSYLAIKGVEAIFRTGVLIFILLFPLIIFILVISFQNVDWHYVYPLWVEDFSFFSQSSYYKSYFAIGGVFLFLGFIRASIPYKNKYVLIAATAVIPIFLLSVYIPILVFGQATASTFLYPFVLAVDSINLTWFMFDRMTMFFLLSIIIFILLFISLVLWMIVRVLSKCIAPSIKPFYLVVAVSLLIFIICLFIPSWKDVEQLFLWNTILRFYVILGVPISVVILGIKSRLEGDIK
ncbi:spore germination protein [Aquibacillus koreensis]|uniref:Spore germination protein n=1 Tax=Aquibacillus koreensis TaxID=279446 RepID=A0A9X3WJT0_9BACI|nr:spore germination protein [Aquibacillus koreensis]MCT2537104.1 spore germination protein [Aquibacillus koreensis]MDC3419913.1 spore germination protein [Aquibacillus koreensis]